jgi:putative ABC transport system substrate-binding protein
MLHVRRREFITLLGGATAALPLTARAQQSAMPVIGYLSSLSPDTYAPRLAAFRKGLAESGYVEGRSIAIEYRWAEGQYHRLPALAADLARREVAVIAAMGGDTSALAAKAATATIPIVFAVTADPVKSGLVSSLNRPGGNVTGVNFLLSMMTAKLFEVLQEVVPNAAAIGFLVNPRGANAEPDISEVRVAAHALGRRLFVASASSEPEIDAAFATLVQERVGALLVGNDVFFYSQRGRIVALAARHAIPAMYNVREYPAAGGLMSYGTSVDDAQRLAGVYVGRILKGAKPADLPVVQSTKVEFVVNLKTAKMLGLTFPLPLIGRADEVIE